MDHQRDCPTSRKGKGKGELGKGGGESKGGKMGYKGDGLCNGQGKAHGGRIGAQGQDAGIKVYVMHAVK